MIGRGLVRARVEGKGALPYEVLRARVCERMGWTFSEFDVTPAVDIFSLLEIWRIDSAFKA